MAQDFRGKALKPGSLIVYSESDSNNLKVGRVTEIVSGLHGKQRVQVKLIEGPMVNDPKHGGTYHPNVMVLPEGVE